MSHTNLNYHIVFATDGRKPFLEEKHLEELCKYIFGITKNLKSTLHIANGTDNHIHLAVALHQDLSISKYVQKVKSSSSKWIHDNFEELKLFAWQKGYGAFSVSHSNINKVANYIRNQQEHHKQVSFEDEFTAFLKKHQIEFDERYIFGG